MGNCFGPALQPPNDKARTYVNILYVFCFCQFIICITGFIIGDSTNGIFSIICMMLLYCSWHNLNHSVLQLYLFVCLVMYITSLILIFTGVQQGVDLFATSTKATFYIFEIIYLVYYIAASIIGFYIYREFKGIQQDGIAGLADYGANNNDDNNNNNNNRQRDSEDNINQQRPKPATKSTFQVFSGKGVRIG